jgi:Protein of unknown function (DUF3017)
VKHAAVKHSARAVARQAKAGNRQAKAGNRQAKAGNRQAKGGAGQAGTGEAAVRRAGTQTSGRRWLKQIPYCVVLAGLVAGLATVRGGGQAVKSGTLVIAGALLAGALIRLVLPDGRAGMLASRRRLADVAVLAALGVGLLVAGMFARVTS